MAPHNVPLFPSPTRRIQRSKRNWKTTGIVAQKNADGGLQDARILVMGVVVEVVGVLMGIHTHLRHREDLSQYGIRAQVPSCVEWQGEDVLLVSDAKCH